MFFPKCNKNDIIHTNCIYTPHKGKLTYAFIKLDFLNKKSIIKIFEKSTLSLLVGG